MSTPPIQIRALRPDELQALIALYQHLHRVDAPLPDEMELQDVWQALLADPRIHCLGAECDGVLVASCILVIVPNLTRGARAYGLIENVVTHAVYRRRGIGSALLRHALSLAWEQRCYKVMLLTGRQDEAVHRFYERVGFRGDTKTGFVALPESAHGV